MKPLPTVPSDTRRLIGFLSFPWDDTLLQAPCSRTRSSQRQSWA